MVPDGWKVQKVSECLERIVDPVMPEPDKLYREIGIRSHAKGIFHKEPATGKSLGNKRVFNIHPNCFVVNIVFAWEQAIAKTSDAELGMIASHRFPMFKPKENRCDINYITYFFKTSRGKYLLKLASPGGAGRNKTLGQGEFAKLELSLPPTKEQNKIAKILSIWDQTIEVTEKLLKNSQQQKKSLMQQLLTGKKRLPGFSEEWNYIKLGEILSKVTNGLTYDTKATNGLPVTRIETISSGRVDYNKVGFAPNEENTKRYMLQPGDILYSHINSLKHIGRVAIYNGMEPIYHGMNLLLLRVNEKAHPDFVYHLLNSSEGKRYANAYAKRAINQASITTTEVKSFKVIVPDIGEQKKIASVLSTADKEIEVLGQKLDYLRQEKKALMQQLLTGKRRVKIDREAA